MNWDDLKVFLAVARSGSVSGGARRLGLQHSTVSRRIHKLEQDLGARLFDRIPGGYELTGEGEALQRRALRMEQEVLAVDGALSGKDRKLSGPLRVTTVDNMAITVMMPIFRTFSERYPDVTLHVMVSNADVSLARREADVAIRLTNTPPDTLIGRRLTTVASAVYGGCDYLDELEKEGKAPEWLGVECCGFHKSWTRQICDEGGHRFYVDDTLLTCAALREGMGVAILPCFLGDSDPALRRHGEPRREWDLGLWLLLHPDLKRTARLLAFRDFMIEEIGARKKLFDGRGG